MVKKFKEYITELTIRQASGKTMQIKKQPVRDISGKIIMMLPAKSRSSKREE